MGEAVKEALRGMKRNAGGPFGAVIVLRGKIVARGHNMVVASHDPTAHAEIVAIRKASRLLRRFDLSACEIYSTCEPCPMCYSAIYWARIPRLYYASSRIDAERLGFVDKALYDVLSGAARNDRLETKRLDNPEYERPFNEWMSKPDRIVY